MLVMRLHSFYPWLEVTSTHSKPWSPPNMDTVSRRVNTTYQASAQSHVPPNGLLCLSGFQKHYTGWRDTFCLHVFWLLRQVWHARYGTLEGSWKVSSPDRVQVWTKLLPENSVDIWIRLRIHTSVLLSNNPLMQMYFIISNSNYLTFLLR